MCSLRCRSGGIHPLEVYANGFKKFNSRHNPLTIRAADDINAHRSSGPRRSVDVSALAEAGPRLDSSRQLSEICLTGRSIRDLPIVGTRGGAQSYLKSTCAFMCRSVVSGANTGAAFT